jgi:hypothetical protein
MNCRKAASDADPDRFFARSDRVPPTDFPIVCDIQPLRAACERPYQT